MNKKLFFAIFFPVLTSLIIAFANVLNLFPLFPFLTWDGPYTIVGLFGAVAWYLGYVFKMKLSGASPGFLAFLSIGFVVVTFSFGGFFVVGFFGILGFSIYGSSGIDLAALGFVFGIAVVNLSEEVPRLSVPGAKFHFFIDGSTFVSILVSVGFLQPAFYPAAGYFWEAHGVAFGLSFVYVLIYAKEVRKENDCGNNNRRLRSGWGHRRGQLGPMATVTQDTESKDPRFRKHSNLWLESPSFF